MSPSSDPSVQRILARAAFLVVPLVAIGLGAPYLQRLLRPAAGPRPEELLDGVRRAAGAEAASPDVPSRPPEGPSQEQIERARETQVALGKAEKGWESVTIISPRVGKVGEDGLETLPFQGFGVSVDSSPEGASVVAGGESLGETPLLATVACKPGSDVRVRVEKPPLPAWERVVRCRADTLVKLSAKLGK